MNVLLVCPFSPGAGAGAARARYEALASSLAGLDQTVHLVLPGQRELTRDAGGVVVHELPPPSPPNSFSARVPALDGPLSRSQALHECLQRVEATTLMDIVDVPLELALGFVTLTRHPGPVILRLTADLAAGGEEMAAAARLLPECLQRAAGLLAESEAAFDKVAQSNSLDRAKPIRVLDEAGGRDIERLSRETVAFYASVVAHHESRPRPRARRVVQVMDALDYGDAVASIARRNAAVLAEVGEETTIYTLYVHPRVAQARTPFDAKQIRDDDGVLFHYWHFSELESFLRGFKGPKAVDFHNITPTRYFSPGTRDYEMTSKGEAQLRRIAPCFDLILADSVYNLEEYAKHLVRPKPTLCLYPTVEEQAVLARPTDERLLHRLREQGAFTFLFVGRVARNKRQDRLMELFDYYWRRIDRRGRLFLVGSYEHSPDYRQELEALRTRLPSGEHITITGKVTDDQLQAYYRAADVFVSASEHEGFGIPLLEAMAHGVPVAALATTAVPETMGRAGILVREWDVPRLAELIHLLPQDKGLCQAILEGQRKNLARFSMAEARRILAAAVDFLKEGRESALMVWRGPGASRGVKPEAAGAGDPAAVRP